VSCWARATNGEPTVSTDDNATTATERFDDILTSDKRTKTSATPVLRNILRAVCRVAHCWVISHDQPMPRSTERTEAEAIALRALGKRLIASRAAAGLTQEEAAARCDVALRTYQDIETGSANPTFLTMLRIATGVGVPISVLAEKRTSAKPLRSAGAAKKTG